jgi:hypothetical protein
MNSQFRQHFTSSFSAHFIALKMFETLTASTEKLGVKLSYKKAAPKVVLKLHRQGI